MKVETLKLSKIVDLNKIKVVKDFIPYNEYLNITGKNKIKIAPLGVYKIRNRQIRAI